MRAHTPYQTLLGTPPRRARPTDPASERALLRAVEIFADLNDRTLDAIRHTAHRRRIEKGATVVRQDKAARSFYVLTGGRLKVTQFTPEGQRVMVRFISPGEMFGGGRYPGTATAIEDGRLIGWTQGAAPALMERHPRLVINVLGTVAGRPQETQARVRELSTKRVDRRIAHALLRLLQQAGRRVGGGIEIAFTISRQDVAEILGTTLHTVSRTVSDWQERGIAGGAPEGPCPATGRAGRDRR